MKIQWVLLVSALTLGACKSRDFNSNDSATDFYRKSVTVDVSLMPGVTTTYLKNTQFLGTDTEVPTLAETPTNKKCVITSGVKLKYKIWLGQESRNGYYYVTLWENPAAAKVVGDYANAATTCPFQKGWVYAKDFQWPDKAFDKPNYVIDYDYGQKLASAVQNISKCGKGGSICYECVADALDSVHGSAINFAHLNPEPYFAIYFSNYWKPEIDEPKFHLTKVWSKSETSSTLAEGFAIAKSAPLGSVIVWDMCGGSEAGHIAIVTKKQYAYSSTQGYIFAPGESDGFTGNTTCHGNPSPQLNAVFFPFKVKK